jgi:hypothetical protein
MNHELFESNMNHHRHRHRYCLQSAQ